MTHTVPPEHAGARLDSFLSIACGWSRRIAQQAILAGQVRINGRRARKGTTLSEGDTVEVADEQAAEATLGANAGLAIEVLYEDSQVLALEKPAGVPSLALAADETDTVANFLLARYPETATVGRGPLESGIVHRLDTDTSGILLVARTPEAWDDLRQQFKQRRVEKEYVAVVEGNVSQAAGIDAPMAAHPRDSRRMRLVPPGTEGALRASTRYRPLQSGRERSVLAVRIKTGARHQIRAHLAEIGHPIVGDRLYGNPRQPDLGRHLLHACYLAFDHPTRGDRIEIRSAPPPEFRVHAPRGTGDRDRTRRRRER